MTETVTAVYAPAGIGDAAVVQLRVLSVTSTIGVGEHHTRPLTSVAATFAGASGIAAPGRG